MAFWDLYQRVLGLNLLAKRSPRAICCKSWPAPPVFFVDVSDFVEVNDPGQIHKYSHIILDEAKGLHLKAQRALNGSI